MNSSIASRFNANLLDEKFALWRDDPGSVDSDWAAFFEGFSLGMAQIEKGIEFSDAPNSVKESSYPKNDILRVTLTDPVFRARVVRLLYNLILLLSEGKYYAMRRLSNYFFFQLIL